MFLLLFFSDTARIVNITGTNTDDEVKTGDEFECEVKGNPEPDVMWISVEGGGPILVDGPVLTVADMEGENTYTCYTNNTFKGRIGTDSRNISFVVAAVVVPTDDPVEGKYINITWYAWKEIWHFWIYIALRHHMCHVKIHLQWKDPTHTFHNPLDKYPTMRHFVTEMRTRVHLSVTKWWIVGYGTGA